MPRLTYRDLDVSDLGNQTESWELDWFVLACQVRQGQTGCTEAEAMVWMWGQDGAWRERAQALADPSLTKGWVSQ